MRTSSSSAPAQEQSSLQGPDPAAESGDTQSPEEKTSPRTSEEDSIDSSSTEHSQDLLLSAAAPNPRLPSSPPANALPHDLDSVLEEPYADNRNRLIYDDMESPPGDQFGEEEDDVMLTNTCDDAEKQEIVDILLDILNDPHLRKHQS